MKIKPSRRKNAVVVELKKGDALPPAPAAGRGSSTIVLERILVPVDFSDCSRQALRYAIPFAREFDAEIVLLYVAQINYPSPEVIDLNLPALEAELRAGGERQLAALVAGHIDPGLRTRTLVRTGQPFREIIDVAREQDIDLIILSTHGRTGLSHVFLGSVAEKVVRHATCPVFVVREKEHEFVFPDTKSAVARPSNESKAQQPSARA